MPPFATSRRNQLPKGAGDPQRSRRVRLLHARMVPCALHSPLPSRPSSPAPFASPFAGPSTGPFSKPSTAALELAPSEGPLDYGLWVVVSGFAPGDFTGPVRALQQIGQVARHCQSSTRGGNFLFVQFAACMERDNAVSQSPLLLSDSVLVSVYPLTPELAAATRFEEAVDPAGLRQLVSPHAARPVARRSGYAFDSVVPEAPRRRVNICKRITRYVFGW
jgi:hypothetical protein